MKTTVKFFLSLMAVAFSLTLQAQTNQVMFKCNFDSESCEEKVMKNIPYEKGVKAVNVDYKSQLVTIDYKASKNSTNELQKALVELGYQAQYLGTPISFGVSGNCDMCKTKIENAAKTAKGVNAASWDVDKKQLTIALANNNDVMEVHQAIAAVGYDTDKLKANDDVYEALHHCCKYER